ncbi:poly(A)-specific ribonuclease PARN-like [Ischnura elegans]|uniref:poly(A)-specific ribonuclease PARN-like n=1 Tax=Ischnura elegans TaxID=197161 RepID=UPI001ED89DE9|nr:poly(A)-specific ribonuclease PARN-like [Ischnura elegans]
MEVTRRNFRQLLPEIQDAIRASSFISIDGEFTGLLDNNVISAFDYPWEYYSKVRKGGMSFLLIQFGLCAFEYDSVNERYTHRAYNFYVYPYTSGRRSLDSSFLCQSSCMEFLAENGFDFNKLFKEGIPYVNFLGEQKLKEDFENQKKIRELRRAEKCTSSTDAGITVPEKYMMYLKEICDKVHEFIKGPEKRLELGDKTNGFVRKLIFETLQKNFNQEGLFVESGIKEGGGRMDRVVILTKEEGSREEILERREEEWRKAMMEELDMAVGFSTVIRAITESNKLVVGHNMLLDVCHCLHQFCAILPEDYAEFKELAHCAFPRLVDTKLMTNMYPFKDKFMNTTLLQLMERLSEEPFKLPEVEPAEGYPGYSCKDNKAHEAGFDAFVTGVCFIGLSNYLGSLAHGTKNGAATDPPLLKPFENKLYLMQVQDIPYIDLVGPDALPPRDHVFYVTFPSTWNMLNLRSLFGSFGSIYVSWLNDTSAFVALEERDKASLVCKTLSSIVGSEPCTVVPFLEYVNQKNNKVAAQGKFSSPLLRKEDHAVNLCRNSSNAETSAVIPSGVKRRRSSGESSFSKRNIEPIPEEREDEIDKPSVAEPEGNLAAGSLPEKKDKKGQWIVSHSDSSTPDCVRAKRAKLKAFDENDSWD